MTRRPIAGDNGPNGYTAYASREVVVRDDVDDAQAVKTLAHAHVLMHDPAGFDRGLTGGCRGDREVEAESVAYLVAAEHGLDTSDYTFAYIAGWATATGDLQAALRDSGTRVLGAAHRVLDRTETRLTQPAPTAGASAVALDADQLAARVSAGADRASALRSAVASPAQSVPRERLLAANAAAAAFFADRFATSWAPEYLAARLGVEPKAVPTDRVGYAPAGWTELTDHLRGGGFSDGELLEAGLAVRARTGRLVDRFRDRLMFPVRSADGQVVGFTGRRNPALDEQAPTAATRLNSTYLNTATTRLYVKGEHLYGLAENREVLNRGGLAVLVEGPLDALAVDVASGGTMAGIAPLGTAFTSA